MCWWCTFCILLCQGERYRWRRYRSRWLGWYTNQLILFSPCSLAEYHSPWEIPVPENRRSGTWSTFDNEWSEEFSSFNRISRQSNIWKCTQTSWWFNNSSTNQTLVRLLFSAIQSTTGTSALRQEILMEWLVSIQYSTLYDILFSKKYSWNRLNVSMVQYVSSLSTT